MTETAGGRTSRSPAALIFNIRVLRVLGQAVAVVVLVAIAGYLSDNYQANTRGRSGEGGWGFLKEPTGFGIAHTDFRPTQAVRDALWIGVRNTAAAAVVGIALASVLGLVIGVLRLSRSFIARKAATLYVEILRNVPVLLILLFTAAWLRTLPRNTDAWTVGGLLEISNRNVEIFGVTFHIEYVAVVLALGLYHASHIAEIVRGSIQAVPYGQTEAATAIGLSPLQQLRFVVLPQAARIGLPPTINQYLSLTKNTSLGIAVSYAESAALTLQLVGGRAPALQMISLLMAIYLVFSLGTSLILNLVNRRLRLVER